MTTMTIDSAARQLSRGCAKHTRIVLLALNADEAYATTALLDRMRADMHDALHDTPDRDDARARAGRYLNACPGPRMTAAMTTAARATIRNIKLLNAPRP